MNLAMEVETTASMSPTAAERRARTAQRCEATAAKEAKAIQRYKDLVLSNARHNQTHQPQRTSDHKTDLFSIPIELRLEIYEYYLESTARSFGVEPAIPIHSEHKHPRAHAEPALLRTSRQLRIEARPLWYRDRSFHIDTKTMDLAPVAEWVRWVGRANVSKMVGLSVYIQPMSWKNARLLIPFLDVVREFEVPIVKVTVCSSPSTGTNGSWSPVVEGNKVTPPGEPYYKYDVDQLTGFFQLTDIAIANGWSSRQMYEYADEWLLARKRRRDPGCRGLAEELRERKGGRFLGRSRNHTS